MKQDEYGTVLNAPETYDEIAFFLKGEIEVGLWPRPVLIAWTDQAGTQLDILFSYHVVKNGPTQDGIHGQELFVSVMRLGAFGFDVKEEPTHYGYIAEKLHLSGTDMCEKVATLINEVKKRLL